MTEHVECIVDGCDEPIHDNAYLGRRCTRRLEYRLGDVTAVTEYREPRRHSAYADRDAPPRQRRGFLAGTIVAGDHGSQPGPLDAPSGQRGGYSRELQLSRVRLAKIGDGGSKVAGSRSSPLPWDERASEATYLLGNTLSTWARHVAEERGLEIHIPWTGVVGPVCRRAPDCAHRTCRAVSGTQPTTPAAVARWLLGHTDWIRHRPEAAVILDEISHAVRQVERVIDRAPERWYAGPCSVVLHPPLAPCPVELYVIVGTEQVTCRECETIHDVASRREWLRASAEELRAHAALASTALTMLLGRALPVGTIRRWKHEGKLEPVDVDIRGRPLYRLGDVIELALSNPPKPRRITA